MQNRSRKLTLTRTLDTPTYAISTPRIPPPTRITHNLLAQIALTLRDRPTPSIHNRTTSRPLPTCLDPYILLLELPRGIRGTQRIPNRQRVVQLQSLRRRILLRIQRRVLRERGGKEQVRPFGQRAPLDARSRNVVFIHCLWEYMLLCCVEGEELDLELLA